MNRKTLVVIAVLGLLGILLWGGSGGADQTVVVGDVAEVAACLDVEMRDGAYHLSDIFCELARILGDTAALGDVAVVAECLGAEARGGTYRVSDILCRIATVLDGHCCAACPSSIRPPLPDEVIFSSVLADPRGGQSTHGEIPNEYIELRNVSDHCVSLHDCVFKDENSSGQVARICDLRPGLVLAPGQSVRFYGREYNPLAEPAGIALDNTGELLTLLCSGRLIDQWPYRVNTPEGEPVHRP